MMKKRNAFLLILSLILFAGLTVLKGQNPAFRWYKGNTHTHSYWSDGDDFPEMIMEWYKSHGYNFVCLSDHNILAEGEKWKEITDNPLRQARFREYLEKYGDQWVSYKSDPEGKVLVKLATLEKYRPLFEEKGEFILIQSEEISDKYQDKPVHLNVLNNVDLIKPPGGKSVEDVIQKNLDLVYQHKESSGRPMVVHLNHPNFGWGISGEDMLELDNLHFFEVYNGHPHVRNYGDESHPGTEEIWDKVLISYIKSGKPLLYGLATDDAHNYLEYKIGAANPGRGWIMVRANELSAQALIEAMEKGDFYASTGVELIDISTTNNKLVLSIKQEAGVNYTIQFWGAASSGNEGILLKETRGIKAAYKMRKKDLYVRAKIISSRLKENPFAQGDNETAWTQPVIRK